MSGIWTAKTGLIPDIKSRCPEHGQRKLSIFRTSKNDVRITASKNWPFPGHRFLMSGIGTIFTGHIPDIILAIFRTSPKGGLWDLIRPVTIRKSGQITSIGRLGVGEFKPVDVIMSFGVPVIELVLLCFSNKEDVSFDSRK